LNALVSRIVCAVGLREAVDLALLLPADLLPFVVFLAVLPATEGRVLPCPAFRAVVALLLAEDFFECVAEGVAVWASNSPDEPVVIKGKVTVNRQANPTAFRILPQMLIIT
jgi:hypothetical protein